jgi:hypothetical protein
MPYDTAAPSRGEFFSLLPRCEKSEVLWPEADPRWPPSLQSHCPMRIAIYRDDKMLMIKRKLYFVFIGHHQRYTSRRQREGGSYISVLSTSKTSLFSAVNKRLTYNFFSFWFFSAGTVSQNHLFTSSQPRALSNSKPCGPWNNSPTPHLTEHWCRQQGLMHPCIIQQAFCSTIPRHTALRSPYTTVSTRPW